jgi:hypothetical protein
MEALLSQYGIAGLQVGLLGLLGWFAKREFDASKKAQAEAKALQTEANEAHAKKLDKVYSRMDCFEASQHACQLANAKDFATKEELGKVWEHTDRNSSDIARIQGVLDKK